MKQNDYDRLTNEIILHGYMYKRHIFQRTNNYELSHEQKIELKYYKMKRFFKGY